MADINSVVLVGRLTRDSDLKYTNGGAAVSKFSLAVNRKKKSGDSWEDEVSFIDCTLFGKLGETLDQYMKKGKQVAVSGELRQSRWEQDGQNRSKIEVIVNSLQLLGGSKDGDSNQRSEPQSSGRHSGGFSGSSSSYGSGPVNDDYYDDDIPF